MYINAKRFLIANIVIFVILAFPDLKKLFFEVFL